MHELIQKPTTEEKDEKTKQTELAAAERRATVCITGGIIAGFSVLLVSTLAKTNAEQVTRVIERSKQKFLQTFANTLLEHSNFEDYEAPENILLEQKRQEYVDAFQVMDTTHQFNEFSRFLSSPENKDARKKVITALEVLSRMLQPQIDKTLAGSSSEKAAAIVKAADSLQAELTAINGNGQNTGRNKAGEIGVSIRLLQLRQAMF